MPFSIRSRRSAFQSARPKSLFRQPGIIVAGIKTKCDNIRLRPALISDTPTSGLLRSKRRTCPCAAQDQLQVLNLEELRNADIFKSQNRTDGAATRVDRALGSFRAA